VYIIARTASDALDERRQVPFLLLFVKGGSVEF